jgi:uncharacterized protein YjbJ (UPF0337 family)
MVFPSLTGGKLMDKINVPRNFSLVLAALTAAAVLSGCATSRGVLDINVPVPKNPAAGPAVKIVKISDLRQFEKAPKSPDIPSLKGGEIDDESITSRAVGRKRNGYGKALGDILLPEDATVAGLVRKAVTAGFRNAGWRVLKTGDPGYEKAEPVELEIDQFWAWFAPGFWSISAEFEADVRVKTALPAFQGKAGRVYGHYKKHSGAATNNTWLTAIEGGIDDLTGDVEEHLGKKK